ncbi:MAG: zinc ribbon domain-containing protein [Microcoleaceae cyanobacterium]
MAYSRCSRCGNIVEKLPLNIIEWHCPRSSSYHDRDINASIKILRMGTRVCVLLHNMESFP